MARRKQRRRREKLRRHEWEEVYVDEEGREVVVEEAGREPRPKEPRAAGDARPPSRGRPVRAMQPPSWRRVLKRGLVFTPVMFVFITIFDPDTPLLARVLWTVQLMLIFIPFSYLMDAFTYRMWRRRTQQADGSASPRRR